MSIFKSLNHCFMDHEVLIGFMSLILFPEDLGWFYEWVTHSLFSSAVCTL